MSSTNPFFKFNDNGINDIFTGVSASHTGSTTETILCSVNIPANRYAVGDMIAIDSMLEKSGNGLSLSPVYKFYWVAGSTATLTGAITLSTRGINLTGTYVILHYRRMYIRTLNGTGAGYTLGTEMADPAQGIFNDYDPGSVVLSPSNISIYWTIDGTIFATITQPSVCTTTQYYIKIWEFPYPVSRIG